MATINNGEVIRQIISDAKIQTSTDDAPTKLAEKVVPVLVANPIREIKTVQGNAIDSVSAVAFTASTTKRTFITAMNLTLSKDAVNAATNSSIQTTLKSGVAENILIMNYEPTTAGQFTTNLDLTHPLEIKKGAVVYVKSNNATASIDLTGIVYYYEVD